MFRVQLESHAKYGFLEGMGRAARSSAVGIQFSLDTPVQASSVVFLTLPCRHALQTRVEDASKVRADISQPDSRAARNSLAALASSLCIENFNLLQARLPTSILAALSFSLPAVPSRLAARVNFLKALPEGNVGSVFQTCLGSRFVEVVDRVVLCLYSCTFTCALLEDHLELDVSKDCENCRCSICRKVPPHVSLS